MRRGARTSVVCRDCRREFPWPEKETYERFALTFLAQIDLAELPEIQSSPLPRSGTLYFFSDPNGDGSGPGRPRSLLRGRRDQRPLSRSAEELAALYSQCLRRPVAMARAGVRVGTDQLSFSARVRKVRFVPRVFPEEGARRLPPRNKQAFDNLLGDELERFLDLWPLLHQVSGRSSGKTVRNGRSRG